MHGRDARLPQELLEKPRKTLYGNDYRAEITRRIQLAFETARENLAENALKQSQRSQIKIKLVALKEGDWVMLFTPQVKSGKKKKLSRLTFPFPAESKSS